MSMQIKIARGQAQGDPGLFGFLGKGLGAVAGVAGSVLPGPLGAAGKAVSRLFGGGGGRVPPGGTMVGTLPIGAPRFPVGPGGGGLGGFGRKLIPTVGGAAAGAAAGAALAGGNGKACERGSRPNKSRYFVERDIFGVKTGGISVVDPGERCVKSRRMNPLNPRALSRSIRRIESAKRATKHLSRITVRSRGCGCK